MKRLGVYVCISIVLLSNLTVFGVSGRAFAQTPSTQTTSTANSALTAKGVGVLETEINKIKAKQVDPVFIRSYGSATSSTFLLYLTESNALIAKLESRKSFFTEKFNEAITKGANPDSAYAAALTLTQNEFGINSKDPMSRIPQMRIHVQSINTSIRLAATEKIDILRYSNDPIDVENAATIARGSRDVQTEMLKTSCTFSTWELFSCINDTVGWLIKNTILQIAGWLLWLTANMFNYAVQIGILNFSQWAPEALYPIWKIVRQIISLFVVFIGLYLGFMYILGKEDKFEKYIPWVIMFALFVNFSYPITRTAIDITNIVSLNVYSSAVGSNALTADLSSRNTAGALIMERLGLQGLIYGVVADTKDASAIRSGNSSLQGLTGTPAALLAVAFVLYAAYIFFMVTALIVMRTASLVFLTLASPLLFVDSVLPVLGDKAQLLRKIFFEQLSVGPIFMIMLALTLKFLEVFASGPMNAARVVGSVGDVTIKTFFNILMMLVMLHIMIKVTKSVSGTLGEYATNAMGKVGGFGLGVASGGVGLLARKGIGGLASKFGQSDWVQKNKDSFVGRSALSMSNSLSGATFDLRNSSVVGGQMNKLGIGMGMGSKMGYTQEREARIEKRVKMGETVGLHRKNVYDDKGKIIHRKGEKDYSPEAEAERERYRKNGGSVFGTMFTKETEEVAERMDAADKTRFQTKYDKALSEYKEKMDDANQDFPEGAAGDDARTKAKDAKQAFFDKQDADTRAKLEKFEAKEVKAKEEKEAEKAERKNAAAATLEAQKAIADAIKSSGEESKAVAAALEKMRNPPNTQTTSSQQPPMVVLPDGMTTTSGGIIVPTNAVVPPRVSVNANSSPTPQVNTTPQKSPIPNINTENVADRWARPADTTAGPAPSSPLPQRPLPPRPQSGAPTVSSDNSTRSSTSTVIT